MNIDRHALSCAPIAGLRAAALLILITGCAAPGERVSQSPPCLRGEPIYFKRPDPLFDPPATVHYSYYCGEGKVAVVRGPRKARDVFGFEHLKPASYTCLDIPPGTVPVCLR